MYPYLVKGSIYINLFNLHTTWCCYPLHFIDEKLEFQQAKWPIDGHLSILGQKFGLQTPTLNDAIIQWACSFVRFTSSASIGQWILSFMLALLLIDPPHQISVVVLLTDFWTKKDFLHPVFVGDSPPLPVHLVLLEPLFFNLKLESKWLSACPTMFLPPSCPGSTMTLLYWVSEV